MKYIHHYLKRLNIDLPLVANYKFLSKFHHAHFYSIPFENIEMKKSTFKLLSYQNIANRIIFNKRGGICFDFFILIKSFFEHIGYSYSVRLARLLTPLITPTTHLLFIVTIDETKWIFDIGYGAKGPRSPLMLIDGYVHEHSFLSSKVNWHSEFGWIVSIKENSQHDAIWENIYAFHDIEALEPDISMAHFYTINSSESLLNTNIVASLPKENGRISIRNNVFTEVRGYLSSSFQIANKRELSDLLLENFGIEIPFQQIREE